MPPPWRWCSFSPAVKIDAHEVVRRAAGTTDRPLRVRWRHAGRDHDFAVPGDSVWISVKDDLLLREYEWAGVRFDELSGVVIDAGAHVGTFSAMAAPYAERVIALEPNAALVPVLRANLAGNGLANVEVDERALWGAEGTQPFDTRCVTTSGSVTADASTGVLVETVTLDRLVAGLPAVDLLKVDIEGAEFAVFDAASDDTLRRIRRVVGEIHLAWGEEGADDRLAERLRSLGFAVELRHGPVYHLRDSLTLLRRNHRSIHGYTRLKLTVLALYVATAALDPLLHLRRRFGGEALRLLYAEQQRPPPAHAPR